MANRSSSTLVNQWFSNPSKDLLSGLVVAFAMIPEAIAFSGIAGVDPKVGLFGAFCLSLTIAVVGGRMAMITSATGSTDRGRPRSCFAVVDHEGGNVRGASWEVLVSA